MKTLWNLFRTRPLLRPTIYLAIAKGAIVLLIALLWERFLDQGQLGIGFTLGALGLILILLCWFNYLSLDGVNPFRNLKKGEKKKKKRKFQVADMIDFVEEPVTSWQELEPEERTACHLVSSFGTGLIFFLLSFVL